MIALDETHNPALPCAVPSAELPGTDFPIQNLPFGVFRPSGSAQPFRGGVAIGDQVVDLTAARARGWFEGAAAEAAEAACDPTLNRLAGLGPDDIAPVLAAGLSQVEFLLLGVGPKVAPPPPLLRQALRDAGLGLEVMDTATAARVYNVLVSEGRRLAAALIAI